MSERRLVSDGATDLAARTLGGLDGLIERLGSAYRTVPEYAALPARVLEDEVLPVSRDIIEGFLRPASEGHLALGGDFPEAAASGRRRLEMGVPLEPMLHVYRIAGRLVFDEIAAASAATEKAELVELGRAWIDYIDEASSAAAAAYLDASHQRLRRLDAQRKALLDSLLDAHDLSDATAVAAEYSISLAPSYVVALVAGPTVLASVDRVTAAAPAGAVTGVRGSYVVVLSPGEAADQSIVDDVPEAVVAVSRPAEPGAALRAELRHSEVVLAVALATGRTGWYGPDDLLIERLLAASPHVASSLFRVVLAPLRAADRGGVVEPTLRSFLSTGSVPATAAAEIVHQNTVAYRLKRVTEVTGLDPRVPAQAALLWTALRAGEVVVDPTTMVP